MGYREVMNESYVELNNITTLLNSMVNSYRLLIGGAAELNNINVAKKSDVKDAVDRVDELGKIIDSLLKVIKETQYGYCKYCEIKHKYIEAQCNKNKIFTEINNELDFHNSEE